MTSSKNPQVYLNQLIAYNQANQQLNTWFTGALSLAALRAAVNSGFLAIVTEPHTVQNIANRLHLAPSWVLQLCQTLCMLHILDCEGDTYTLSADLRSLLAPDAPLALTDTLGIFEVFMREMENIFLPKRAYGQLPDEDKLKVARGKWGKPSSALARYALQQLGAQMPEVEAIWDTHGRHLELGCGAGRDLLCVAMAYPQVEVTGVDIDLAVLSYAEQNARDFNIMERVNLIHADVRTLDYQESFDTVAWSQIFFSLEIRKTVLEVSYRSLKPGGYLLLPLQHERPNTTEPLRVSEKGLLLLKLVYQHWGLNPLDTKGIRNEAEQGGFDFIRVVSVPYHIVMLLRKPPKKRCSRVCPR